jgi:hypothetical protein
LIIYRTRPNFSGTNCWRHVASRLLFCRKAFRPMMPSGVEVIESAINQTLSHGYQCTFDTVVRGEDSFSRLMCVASYSLPYRFSLYSISFSFRTSNENLFSAPPERLDPILSLTNVMNGLCQLRNRNCGCVGSISPAVPPIDCWWIETLNALDFYRVVPLQLQIQCTKYDQSNKPGTRLDQTSNHYQSLMSWRNTATTPYVL